MSIGDLLGELNHAANSINPFKGITDWATNHSLAYIPGVGKPLAQAADWGDSHPAQVGAAIGAAFGGSALLGAGGADAAGAGAGAGAEAGGAGAGAGAGADGLGSALTTSSGFGGVGTDSAVSGLDGASVDPALAGDDIDAGGGWSPASGSNGGMNWQQMAQHLLSHQQQPGQSGGGQGQAIQFNTGGQPQSSITPQQRMAQALMTSNQNQPNNPQGQYSATQGLSQLANSALAAYLMNTQSSH